MTGEREAEGRRRLAEWKARHAASGDPARPYCIAESGASWRPFVAWPCPTALLIAAVEEALDAQGSASEVLAILAGAPE